MCLVSPAFQLMADPAVLAERFLAYGRQRMQEMEQLHGTISASQAPLSLPVVAAAARHFAKPGGEHVHIAGELPSGPGPVHGRRGRGATSPEAVDPFAFPRHMLSLGCIDAEQVPWQAGQALPGPATGGDSLPTFPHQAAAAAALAGDSASAVAQPPPELWLPSHFASHLLCDIALSQHVARPKALLRPLHVEEAAGRAPGP